MQRTTISSVTYDEHHLRIAWKDGKECSFPLLDLRRNCPCATCRGGHEVYARRTTGNITEATLRGWKPMGHYALQLFWNDGHNEGIYTLDGLRHYCDEGIAYGSGGLEVDAR